MHVGAGERDVLRVGDAGRPVAAAQHRHREADAHGQAGVADGPVAHQAERRRDLGRVLGRQAEQRAVEERRLVEVVEGLGERDVVDVRDRRCPRGAPVGSKSASQLTPSVAVWQKNTAVPSGAVTPSRSASAGPWCCGRGGASSAAARPAAAAGVGRLDAERGHGRPVRSGPR